ncbi:MAG TPA: Imm1 family immunity protein [Planctomycetota bacterium]
MAWQVEWRNEPADRCRALAELDALLDRLHREGKPILVQVTGPSKQGTLGIGLGLALSVLSHTPDSGEPPYRVSLGDPLAEGGTDFFMAGHHTEMENRWLIPMDLAREAMRHFCRTGELSDSVVWDEV